MIKNSVKTRFAPSPTGLMHFGNVRAALFNYLYAKHQGGKFLLRIEDTDVARSEGLFRDAILSDLEWLGLNWDEGPYYQSERQSIYDAFYDTLAQQGRTYPCFCSEAQLAITRKVQLSSGQPPRYPGTCLHLTKEEVELKKAQGSPWVIRFHVPRGERIEFVDLVKGPQKFDTDHIGDFIIRRHDGTAPFMYCNAIDDALMGVTCALRGDDHLTNTPRQIMILQALNLAIPKYGHCPTILGSDGKPLSKRTGSRSIQELREEGYLPLGILNYLARLGHHDPNMQLWSLSDLAKRFQLENIGKSAAHFDVQQLHFWQKEAMHHASAEECWALIAPYVSPLVPKDREHAFVQVIQANLVMPADARLWAERLCTNDWSYTDDTISETLKQAGKEFFKTALDILATTEDPKAFIETLQAKTNLKGKALFMPIRATLTGVLHGPELPKIMSYLGHKTVVERFTKVLHYA